MEGSALSFLYLGALLISIAGLATLDFKYKLALGKNKAYRCLLILSVAFFLIWDLAGIALGIFFRGGATHLTGITISNELPIEEIFFLIVLSYTGLILLKAFGRLVRQ